MPEILRSKKFQAAVCGVVAAVAGRFGLDLPVGDLLAILSPILTFIAAQGVADIGKGRAQVEHPQ